MGYPSRIKTVRPQSHLKFTEIPQPTRRKTKVWAVTAKKDGNELGEIRWLAGWRKYVFAPGYETFYDDECLAEITAFIRKAMREWRRSK